MVEYVFNDMSQVPRYGAGFYYSAVRGTFYFDGKNLFKYLILSEEKYSRGVSFARVNSEGILIDIQTSMPYLFLTMDPVEWMF